MADCYFRQGSGSREETVVVKGHEKSMIALTWDDASDCTRVVGTALQKSSKILPKPCKKP